MPRDFTLPGLKTLESRRVLGSPAANGDGLSPADQGRQRVSPRPLKARLGRRSRRCRRGRGRRRRLLPLLLFLEGHAVALAGVAFVENDLQTVSVELFKVGI